MRLFPIILSFLFILFVFNGADAQVIISDLSYHNALKKAEKQEKILMVIMDEGICKQCSDIVTINLDNDQASPINKMAVTVRYFPNSPDWDVLNKKYPNKISTLNVLCFNTKGDLIYRFHDISSNANKLVKEVSTAQQYSRLPSTNDRLAELKKTKLWNIDSLNQLWLAYRKLAMPTDDLMKAFVNTTPVDSFKTFKYFKALAYFAPLLHTEENVLLRNSDFATNWNKIDAKTKSNINQEITNKTMDTAWVTKNYLLAEQAANYIASNTNVDVKEQHKIRIELLKNFFFRVKDTANYFKYTTIYVDSFFMNWPVDSLKQFYIAKEKNSIKDSLYLRLKYSEDENPLSYQPYAAIFYTFSKTLHYNAIELRGATNNPFYLQKALDWATRANEYNPRPEVLETCATLFYKLGKKEDAIAQEQKVIAEEKRLNRKIKDIAQSESILLQMQNNNLDFKGVFSTF